MSIIFHHYKQLLRMSEELNQMKGKKDLWAPILHILIFFYRKPINAQTKE
jgi:hypothetical protein